jgi:hypothetical protein
MCTVSHDEPGIAVEELRRNREIGSDRWLFGWRIQNLTQQPIKFLAARCPHGKFRSGERIFEPPLSVAGGENATIEMPVLCNEPAGTIVENAFLILLVQWLETRWRLFVRLRVTINGKGEPETATELITTQRAGFFGAG